MSTQQNEALQAVRLLFDSAVSGRDITSAQAETFYQARKLLEGFIGSAGVLESKEPMPAFELFDNGAMAVISGLEYRVGETVEILPQGYIGDILCFLPTGDKVELWLSDKRQNWFAPSGTLRKINRSE